MLGQKYIAFLIGTLFSSVFLFSQEKQMRFEVEGKYHVGYIISHRNDIEVLVKGYTRIGELNFTKRFNGNKDWQLKHNYPYFGVSFFYFDFSNPQDIGNAFASCATWELPITRAENFQLALKLGVGLGYVEKVFHPAENYKNYATSTHLNGFAHLNMKARYRFSHHFNASLGLSFSHFSNASYKKPNLGMNIPALNVGIGYSFKEKERKPKKEKLEYVFNRKWDHDMILSYGVKEKNPIGSDLYKVYSYAYTFTKRFSYKSRAGLGADISYNGALEGELNTQGETITEQNEKIQIGMNLGYYFQIENLTIFLNQGVYLYSEHRGSGGLYNRMGFRYVIKEHFIINASMRTHLAVADHIEYGLGYRF